METEKDYQPATPGQLLEYTRRIRRDPQFMRPFAFEVGYTVGVNRGTVTLSITAFNPYEFDLPVNQCKAENHKFFKDHPDARVLNSICECDGEC